MRMVVKLTLTGSGGLCNLFKRWCHVKTLAHGGRAAGILTVKVTRLMLGEVEESVGYGCHRSISVSRCHARDDACCPNIKKFAVHRSAGLAGQLNIGNSECWDLLSRKQRLTHTNEFMPVENKWLNLTLCMR